MQYLPRCVGLVSLSARLRGTVHVAAGVRVSFLLQLNDVALDGHSAFPVSAHPSMDTAGLFPPAGYGEGRR